MKYTYAVFMLLFSSQLQKVSAVEVQEDVDDSINFEITAAADIQALAPFEGDETIDTEKMPLEEGKVLTV